MFNFGFVNDLVLRSGRLYVAGTFSTVAGKPHAGLASLNPTTGALDPFINVQFAGHHNDSGTGAQGWVGPWDIDVTADGATMVVIGNFKTADGLLRDQVAMLDLTGSSAMVDALGDRALLAVLLQLGFRQLRARGVLLPRRLLLRHQRHRRRQRHPVRLRPPALRDRPHRHRRPADLGRRDRWGHGLGRHHHEPAVYIGGHNRWNNNPHASTRRSPAPCRGPAWPPSTRSTVARSPGTPAGSRSAGGGRLHATATGLWIGSNTDWIGNFTYQRPKLAFFPYAGETEPASTSTAGLPGTAYLGGSPTIPGDALTEVSFDGSSATAGPCQQPGHRLRQLALGVRGRQQGVLRLHRRYTSTTAP